MIRRQLPVIAAVAASALAVLGATPAQAEGAAPTNVVVAWDPSQQVKVNWEDAPETPNRVQFAGVPESLVVVPADAPNEALLSAFLANKGPEVGQVSVEVGDDSGATSPAALSAEFDHDTEPPVVFDTLQPHGSTFTATWRAPMGVDKNPDDPLDAMPGSPPNILIEAGGECLGFTELRLEGTRSGILAPTNDVIGPITSQIWNAWGFVRGQDLWLLRTLVPTTVASGTPFARPVAIVGTSRRSLPVRGMTSHDCGGEPDPDPGRTVHLQARSSATSAWYGVGTTKTAADGGFRFAPLAIGARQFRVVESAISYPGTTLTFRGGPETLTSGVSPPATASTTAWVRSARFLQPAIHRGDRSTAHVWITPGLNTTALLQRWSSGRWVNVKQVAMVNGVADYRFTPSVTSGWRWVTPATRAPNGLIISWTATAAFWISVS